ncbi:MAG: hypothetical protein Q4D56_14405 [Bacteroides sp.]|nr:hypothetical protein [Bacteroides sp.]
MKVIYNDIIPFGDYTAINLFGIVFVRKGKTLSDKSYNHEHIHLKQMQEMLWIGFYVWYAVEYLIKRWSRTRDEAYDAVSFEREAHAGDDNPDYISSRKHYAWFKYIKKSAEQISEGGES